MNVATAITVIIAIIATIDSVKKNSAFSEGLGETIVLEEVGVTVVAVDIRGVEP